MIEIVVFTLPFNGCSEHLPICVGSISRHVRGGLKTFFLFGFVGDSSQFKFIKSTGVCDPGLGVICLQTVNDMFYNTNHRFHLPLSRFTPTLGRWHKTLPYQGGGVKNMSPIKYVVNSCKFGPTILNWGLLPWEVTPKWSQFPTPT